MPGNRARPVREGAVGKGPQPEAPRRRPTSLDRRGLETEPSQATAPVPDPTQSIDRATGSSLKSRVVEVGGRRVGRGAVVGSQLPFLGVEMTARRPCPRAPGPLEGLCRPPGAPIDSRCSADAGTGWWGRVHQFAQSAITAPGQGRGEGTIVQAGCVADSAQRRLGDRPARHAGPGEGAL